MVYSSLLSRKAYKNIPVYFYHLKSTCLRNTQNWELMSAISFVCLFVCGVLFVLVVFVCGYFWWKSIHFLYLNNSTISSSKFPLIVFVFSIWLLIILADDRSYPRINQWRKDLPWSTSASKAHLEHHTGALTCTSNVQVGIKGKIMVLGGRVYDLYCPKGENESHTNPADWEQQSRPIWADSSEAESKFPVK